MTVLARLSIPWLGTAWLQCHSHGAPRHRAQCECLLARGLLVPTSFCAFAQEVTVAGSFSSSSSWQSTLRIQHVALTLGSVQEGQLQQYMQQDDERARELRSLIEEPQAV
eukprot:728076-Amphidinium_carterae.1